jgi:hypothetical protein
MTAPKGTPLHRPPCPGPAAHVTRHGHPSCTGHVRAAKIAEQPGHRVRVAGMPCAAPPMLGTTTCKMHGVNGRTKTKAAQNVALAKAAAKVELFGARRDIEPGAALLELVQWTAGEVDFWRQEVRDLEREDLTWGVTRVKEGGDDRGTTEEAKPAIAYAMLTSASDRLARYCVEALKAGVAERQVRLAEDQGIAVANVLRVVLAAMLTTVIDTLRGLGVSDTTIVEGLTTAWGAAMSVVVPRELRQLTEGAPA